jgi:hypothetical protein
MLHYLREVLHGDYSLLWTDLVMSGTRSLPRAGRLPES